MVAPEIGRVLKLSDTTTAPEVFKATEATYSERSKAEHNGSVNGNERLAFKVIPSHLAILHAFEKQPPVTIIYLYGHAWFNTVVVATLE